MLFGYGVIAGLLTYGLYVGFPLARYAAMVLAAWMVFFDGLGALMNVRHSFEQAALAADALLSLTMFVILCLPAVGRWFEPPSTQQPD